jgi:hypothetical protein
MRSSKSLVIGLFVSSALAVAGCKKKEETIEKAPGPVGSQVTNVTVQEVTMGSAVGPDKKVVQPKDEFAPNETIYVSVETDGTAPEATVTARWTFGDEEMLVDERSQKIIPRDAVATEFHVQKADGWPAGEYKVDILLNGEKVASEQFEVKAGG